MNTKTREKSLERRIEMLTTTALHATIEVIRLLAMQGKLFYFSSSS